MTVDSAGGVGKVWVGGLAGSGLCALRPDEREALIGTSKVRNHVGRNTGAGVLLAAAIAAIALIASNTIHLSPSSDQPPPRRGRITASECPACSVATHQARSSGDSRADLHHPTSTHTSVRELHH